VLHSYFLFMLCQIDAQNRCIVFVTDSMCSLHWLASSRLKRYPWYRLSPILPIFEQIFRCKIIIRWTPSELQPADKASRGITQLKWGQETLTAGKLPRSVSTPVLKLLFIRNALSDWVLWKRLCSSLKNPSFAKISKVPPPHLLQFSPPPSKTYFCDTQTHLEQNPKEAISPIGWSPYCSQQGPRQPGNTLIKERFPHYGTLTSRISGTALKDYFS